MATFFAYLAVVLIWATTPLAIQWSSDSLSFMAAVVARMALALALALLIHALLRRKLRSYRDHALIYVAASIGIFPNMPVVYWAAQFIPSGLVAVIFAMSPFATGLLSILLLKQNPFSARRLLALVLALAGLAIIFAQQMQLDSKAVYGIAGIVLSCFLFSFSSVWLKKLTAANTGVDAFQQATGALLFALPGLLVCWWWMDFSLQDIGLPASLSSKSLGAVVYLALMGSLVGSVLFFYVLQRLSPSLVSLITLMTPVLAILLGRWAADEALPAQTLVGVGVVLFGLLLYMPWTLRQWRLACARFFYARLQKEALSDEANPGAALEAIREDMFRYK